ncbi:MAG: hypothetical protein ACT6S0_04640 [Roseateles sp.]|uniref:hypothetical protein n=1 Tax=Roseateles sp. TaxID=1971397 RepID=UPI004035B9A0
MSYENVQKNLRAWGMTAGSNAPELVQSDAVDAALEKLKQPPVVPLGALPYQPTYPTGHVMRDWSQGWNACLDCITGKAMDGREPILMDECDRQRLALAICPELRSLIERSSA